MQRPTFLRVAGALVVTFASPAGAGAQTSAPAREANPAGTSASTDVDAWLAIEPSGDVKISWGKVELGTGIDTAVLQLAADELDVPLSRVALVPVGTDTPNQGYTAGSQSLTAGALAVRQAAAVARQTLIAMAAQRLSVAPDALRTADGYVFSTQNPAQRIGYGELVGGRKLNARVENPQLRPQTADRISGTSIPRIDVPAKLFGTYTYVQDVALLGMLHARVIYPPQPGATLQSYDVKSLGDIPEHVSVVRKDNFLAVVAADEWHAVRAARELRVKWQPGPALPAMDELTQFVRTTAGTDRSLGNDGDVDAALHAAKNVLSARYEWPFQSHGSIDHRAR